MFSVTLLGMKMPVHNNIFIEDLIVPKERTKKPWNGIPRASIVMCREVSIYVFSASSFNTQV
jgi:hypothetical protein